jgi:hypothetical protein
VRNIIVWVGLVALIEIGVAFGGLSSSTIRLILLILIAISGLDVLTTRAVRRAWTDAVAGAKRLPPPPTLPSGLDSLGPNHERVERFLKRLPFITDEEWRVLLAVSDRANYTRKEAAVRRLYTLGRTDERERAADAVRFSLLRRAAIAEAGTGPFSEPSTDSIESAAKAAEALVVEDLLDPQDFQLLYGHFEPLLPKAAISPKRGSD